MTRAAAVVRSPAAWLLTLSIVLIALNMRGPIVAPAPVLDQMSADLGLTAVVAGLLTSIPVLCFALASPLASSLIVKVGALVVIVLFSNPNTPQQLVEAVKAFYRSLTFFISLP